MSDPSDIRQSSVSSAPKKKSFSVSYNSKTLIRILVVILLVIIAFWLGILYGQHHDNANKSNSSLYGSSGRVGRGFGRFGNGGIGTVSSVSSSSITIDDQRSGTTKTYTITSSTKITDNGTSVNASSIATGDTVLVTTSSSSSSDGTNIIVNPSFGGFGSPGGSSSSTGGGTGTGSSTSGSITTQ